MGGRSRASVVDSKPCRLCVPSQNGLLAERPQRHKLIALRPPRPNSAPSCALRQNSPSIRKGPLLMTLIVVFANVRTPVGGGRSSILVRRRANDAIDACATFVEAIVVKLKAA